MASELSEQEEQRRLSLNSLREIGIEPFPAALFPVDSLTKNLKSEFTEGKKVVLAFYRSKRRNILNSSRRAICEGYRTNCSF